MKARINLKSLLTAKPRDLSRKWTKSVSFSLPVWRIKKLFTKKKNR